MVEAVEIVLPVKLVEVCKALSEKSKISPIVPKNTNVVDDIAILLPVKIR